MGREIREVPENWQHPRDDDGHYIPLFGRAFTKELSNWLEHKKKWDEGYRQQYDISKSIVWIPKEEKYASMHYEEWDGEKPEKKDYMPEWPDAEKTHIQLYEDTTKGTPITPVFLKNDFEKLCEYAAANCSTFADCKATKEEWIQMLKSDFSVHHVSGNIIFI